MAADRWDMHVAEVVGKKKKPEYPRPKSKSKTSKGGRSLRSLFPGR